MATRPTSGTRACRSHFPDRPDLYMGRTTVNSPRKDRLWGAMRIMRARFTVADLMTVCEMRRDVVQTYVRALLQAGYLRLLKPNVPGTPGGYAVYALIRDTGPLAPIRWLKPGKGVFDRNTNTAYGLMDTQEARNVE